MNSCRGDKPYRLGPGVISELLDHLPQKPASFFRKFSPIPALDCLNQAPTVTIRPKIGYRWHFGFIAWFIHRLTGIGLAAYLLLHLYVLSHLADGPAEFDQLMATFHHPVIKLLEICLLAVVVFHSINGLRIVLLDYGPLAEKSLYVKAMTYTFIVIGFIIVVGGLGMILKVFGL